MDRSQSAAPLVPVRDGADPKPIGNSLGSHGGALEEREDSKSLY